MAAEYAFDLSYDYYNNNAAPVLTPEKKKERTPELRKLKKRRPATRELEKASHVKAAKLFALMAVAIAFAGTFCNSMVARNESRLKLQSCKSDYELYQNESIVLKDRLSKLVSANNIDEIAVERLGLVKVIAANEVYLESEKENEVLFSSNR